MFSYQEVAPPKYHTVTLYEGGQEVQIWRAKNISGDGNCLYFSDDSDKHWHICGTYVDAEE
jgi:hypothetical protein